MLAVVRIRGTGRIERSVVDTLKILRLAKPHHCIILKKSPVHEGMLRKVKDYVTWGELEPEMLEKLIEARGKSESIAAVRKSPKKEVEREENIESRVFRLSPPKLGFSKKGVKKTFRQGGELGYRGDKINELIKRMI